MSAHGRTAPPGDFWSRRKAAVAAEREAEAEAVETKRRADAAAALDAKDDAEVLATLNLKAPEELQAGDDFTAFLREEVPARLRQRALRRLWASNPVLANVDGLVEYGEDYTDAATVVEKLQTVYRIGRGMVPETEAQEPALPVPDDDAELAVAAAEPAPDTVPAKAPTPEPEATDQAPHPPPAEGGQPAPAEPERVVAAPRRLRFAFDPAGPSQKGEA